MGAGDDWIEVMLRSHWATERDKTGLEKAQARFDKRDYESESRELTQLLEGHEPHTSMWLLQDARFLRAQCYAKLGKFDLIFPDLCAGLDYERGESGEISRKNPPTYLSDVKFFLEDNPELQPRIITPKIMEIYGLMYYASSKGFTDEDHLRRVFAKCDTIPLAEQEEACRAARDWKGAREQMGNERVVSAIEILEELTSRKLIHPFPAYTRVDLFVCYDELRRYSQALSTIEGAIASYSADRIPIFEPVFRQAFLQEHPELDAKHL